MGRSSELADFGVAASAGATVQTRYNSSTTEATTTDTTRVLAISHTITPKTGNDVMILGIVSAQIDTAGQRPMVEILRGNTQLITSQFGWGVNNLCCAPVNVLDTTPGGDGSTAITYSIKIWIAGGGGTLYVNYDDGTAESLSSITLCEVQA